MIEIRIGTIDVKEGVGRVCDNVRLRRCRHRRGRGGVWSCISGSRMICFYWLVGVRYCNLQRHFGKL